ncbi:Ribokinase-like protein [Amanita muscaria]
MGTTTTFFPVLTIAGSDSSGGAGIQADLKTITCLGCYGASAITALTAQNTTGVQGIHPCPPHFVEQQISSVLQDIDIHAIKTGMLHDTETVQAVARALKTFYSDKSMPPIVCDPVCVSTSGHTLLHPDAVGAMARAIFPLSTVITPNTSEAELLLSTVEGLATKIVILEDMISASSKLLHYGSRAVLLKGGHITVTMSDISRIASGSPNIVILQEGFLRDSIEILRFHAKPRSAPLSDVRLAVDVLALSDGQVILFVRPWIESQNTHGTGCTLSSALACELARGLNRDRSSPESGPATVTLIEATKNAILYVYQGIITAPSLGKGNGPLNHLHSIQNTSVCKPNQYNQFPLTVHLIEDSFSLWEAYVKHDFVRQLGTGTLDRKSFVHFIKQDYHYLRYYSRAYGYLAAKCTDFSAIEDSAKVILNVIDEIGKHRGFCQHFGVTPEELENTPESAATTAYGAYILDMGLQGDSMKLFMALIACLLGYGEVGLWLKREAEQDESWVLLDGNPYKPWIDVYSGTPYQESVKKGLGRLQLFNDECLINQLL